jgi:hypothetical protein
MNFMDYFVKEVGYYVTETPNIIAENQRKRGYGSQDGADDGLKTASYHFELNQVSRDEIEKYAKRRAFGQQDQDFGVDPQEIQSILLHYFDDFIERYFIFESPDTQSQVKIHKGYRAKRGKDGSRPVSEFIVSFMSVQPSREEIENRIAFYIAHYLKK